MNVPQTSYRPDIDGLRAVAVLSVVLCHAGLLMPGGYVGVDVFFVISGFLITGLIIKDLKRGQFSLSDFWERRTRRILPALVVVTVATMAAGWFLLLPEAFASLAKSVVGLSMLISNVYFWRSAGYFESSSEELPMLHTWSLAVEEQFYLIVPIVLIGLFSLRRSKYISAVLVIAAIASLALSVYGVSRHPDATFYLLPTRAWELLVGAILAIHAEKSFQSAGMVRELAAAIGLAAILAPCFIYQETTRFPGQAAIPVVLGTAILIATGRSTGRPAVNRLLCWKPIVFVGLISYSLYLWHWPLFAFARIWSPKPLEVGQRLLLVLAGLICAILSWRFVEQPFRHGALLRPRRNLFIGAAICYGVLISTGLIVARNKGFASRMPENVAAIIESSRLNQKYHINLGVDSIPSKLRRFGNDEAEAKILVWGDSHAMALLPGIDRLSQERNVTFVAATHSSTAPVLNYFFRARYGLNERSLLFNKAVVNYIESSGIQSVVLAARWSSYSKDPEFSVALLSTVDRLQKAGVSVYFFKNVPEFYFDVPKLLSLYAWRGLEVSSLSITPDEYNEENSYLDDLLPKLADRGVIVLDSMPLLLSGGAERIVPFTSTGTLYRDRHHLSDYGANYIKNVFNPVFESKADNKPLSDCSGSDEADGSGF